MLGENNNHFLEMWKASHPQKFATETEIFSYIRRGDYIFVSSGCGEPQYLVNSLVKYVEANPKAFDTEIIHIYSFGIAPYTDQKFKKNFRHNSFFIGDNTSASVNEGASDYTPISLSNVPALLRSGYLKIDVALIQTSPPNKHGFLSLGVSIDMVRFALETAPVIIAQINSNMPRTHGDGFIHIKDVNYIIPHDEPLIELSLGTLSGDTAQKIGQYVSRIIDDGDTIQVGIGIVPNEIMAHLGNKKHLGVHTELLSDGLINLMKLGVVDNSRKTTNRGKTIASFCMGKKETYEYIDDNPSITFRTIDYTNDPLIISQEDNMVAINSAQEIDLTGQATSESISSLFYSGTGVHQDFMRGAVMAQNGKTILTLQSTALDDTVSRIVPGLSKSAGVTLNRSDVRYVVTEYGIAYLHGKTIRERAMDLIAIAHPRFRPWLLEEAKKTRTDLPGSGFHSRRKRKIP